jgi:predicted anti-sigma-YlaC factor YlaD
MTSLSCAQAEERIATLSPAAARSRLAAPVADDLGGHLEGCADCRELLEGIAGLAALGATLPPPEALVARTLSAAAAEVRRSAALRRSAARRAGLKAVLAFLAGLPLVIGLHALVAAATLAWVLPLLPEAARIYVELLLAALALGALSTVVFLLTLFTGAAARPPRPILEA